MSSRLDYVDINLMRERSSDPFILDLLDDIQKNIISDNLSISQCAKKASELFERYKSEHKLKKIKIDKNQIFPSATRVKNIYLYNPEGSIIRCYTFATSETSYPNYPYLKPGPGSIITSVNFNIISKMHRPSFRIFDKWYKKQEKEFSLINQSEMLFYHHETFLQLLKVAIKDDFDLYVGAE